MSGRPKISFIEKLAASVGLIPDLSHETQIENLNPWKPIDGQLPVIDLHRSPPPEQWDHWTEFDANAWPNAEKREYMPGTYDVL